jgi:hypothetical protein
MFEKIVIESFYLSRHRAAPLARERELFLAHLHSGGNRLGVCPRIHLFLLNSLEKLGSGMRIVCSHGENISILPSRTEFTVTSEPS